MGCALFARRALCTSVANAPITLRRAVGDSASRAGLGDGRIAVGSRLGRQYRSRSLAGKFFVEKRADRMRQPDQTGGR